MHASVTIYNVSSFNLLDGTEDLEAGQLGIRCFSGLLIECRDGLVGRRGYPIGNSDGQMDEKLLEMVQVAILV